MASLVLLRRRHPHRSAFSAHLLRRFSALPDVDPSPTSPPNSSPAAPASTRTSFLDLQLAVRGETDPARIHSLVASALSDPTIPRLHTSRPLFSLAASRLARLRRPDLAASLLHLLLASSPASPGLLARAVSLFPGPDDALRAFSSSAPSARSDVSLSALLSALLRAGRLDDLKSTFHSAESSLGVAPGRASHNVLLHALVKNTELAAARQMLDEMANKKVKHRPAPDIISYNTVLAGYSMNDDEEGFAKLLKEINASKLEPNVVTYNCRIQWFAKKGETFKGEELLYVMESKEVAPNYLTYNALVRGYCKEGNVGAAMRVFKRMKVMKRREGRSDLGVSAHSQTYVVLFRGLVEKERLDDALWICKSFAVRPLPPTGRKQSSRLPHQSNTSPRPGAAMPAGQPRAHEPDGGFANHSNHRPHSPPPPPLPAEVVPAFPPPESVDDESWVWAQIKAEARRDADAEPALASFLYATVLSHPSLPRSLSFHLANKLCSSTLLSTLLYDLFLASLTAHPSLRAAVVADLLAARSRDPACVGFSQCLLNFKGFLAIQAHRIAHFLWAQHRRPLALALQSRVADVFAVDIHPAAVVGKGILLDHATGVVIGETAIVGDNVSILHHVTLGGTGKAVGDRHPKIGDGVLIGAGATILGNVKIGAGAKIGAGSVVLIDVPARSTAVGNPARLIGGKKGEAEKDEDMPGESMDHTSFIRQWSDYTI